ncbi:MAG: hypothetical protein AAB675_02355 [Patescibacteria group bacterium]
MTERNRIITKETEKIAEQYSMVMAGGRIKTAGASIDHIYQVAKPLIDSPNNPDAAFETSRAFAAFKEKPPLPFRVAFFPQDEVAMRTAFRRLGIYRPSIKTDQGPAGNVGYFRIDESKGDSLKGRILREDGVALPEEFLKKRLSCASLETQRFMQDLFAEVQVQYQRGSYREAYQIIAKIRQVGELNDIETTRRAGVGRQELFFFRPVQVEDDVIIGGDLADRISTKTSEVVARVEQLAFAAKLSFKSGLSIKDAITRAYEIEDLSTIKNSSLLYFQPDILIRKDGSFDIERINIPDLGMFLTEIEKSNPNETLRSIQDISNKIKEVVLNTIADQTNGDVIIITRDEVLQNCEDTLEILEVQAIKRGLLSRDKSISVSSLGNIAELPNGCSIVLLNVSPEANGYESLLSRVAIGEIQCYPDPFIKLFEKEATTFERKKIDEPILSKFLNIIEPQTMDKREGVYAKYLAIQNAMKQGGIDSDIVYFAINDSDNYIPTFRYDIRSFFEVYKAVENERRKEKRITSLTAIPLPFQSSDAIMEGNDGPRLAVFRFMFVRK